MNTHSQAYKESTKSICHHCTKINDDCFHAAKFCGTDNKIGKSYVSSCNEFEDKKEQKKEVYLGNGVFMDSKIIERWRKEAREKENENE